MNRRDFLKRGAGAVALLPLVALAPQMLRGDEEPIPADIVSPLVAVPDDEKWYTLGITTTTTFTGEEVHAFWIDGEFIETAPVRGA